MDKLLEFALLAWEATAALFGSWKVVAMLGAIILANVGGLVYLGTRGGMEPVQPAQTLQAKPAQAQKVDGAKPVSQEEILKAKKARAAKIKAQLQKK